MTLKNHPEIRVAVTGVGGGVGQSVLKALSLSKLPLKIFPVDVQPFSSGLYMGREGKILPPPEQPSALKEWEQWLREEDIDVLIPGSDHDLPALAAIRDEWEQNGVCLLLLSDQSLVDACRDKAVLTKQLLEAGLPSPDSRWEESPEEILDWIKRDVGFPVIIKPRSGFASKNVEMIQDEEEFRFYIKRIPKPIVQEYLTMPSGVQEFTCSVFRDRDGQNVGVFMSRRDLVGGATYRAEVNHWPELETLLLQMSDFLKPRGPMNVQLRLTERGPVPFEVNIRCSGTSAIRAYFGYNEPEMFLRNYVLGQELEAPQVRKGYALRYWNEVFLEGVDRDALKSRPANLQGKIMSWP